MCPESSYFVLGRWPCEGLRPRWEGICFVRDQEGAWPCEGLRPRWEGICFVRDQEGAVWRRQAVRGAVCPDQRSRIQQQRRKRGTVSITADRSIVSITADVSITHACLELRFRIGQEPSRGRRVQDSKQSI